MIIHSNQTDYDFLPIHTNSLAFYPMAQSLSTEITLQKKRLKDHSSKWYMYSIYSKNASLDDNDGLLSFSSECCTSQVSTYFGP